VKNIKGPLREGIQAKGQPYVDRPVVVRPRNTVASHVAGAFGNVKPTPVQVGTERVELQWMEPDGHGGLRPKYPNREPST
jgi:hypothetical protein